jgi:tRNA threonylcarbamoyladenosine biosynthesis protein TsaB
LALILNIETSTKTCSVAIGFENQSIASKEIQSDQFVHGEKLHLLIESLFNEKKIGLDQIDAIAISAGPGSFTGLRIGVSSAKGLAYALNVPLISVITMDLMMNCYSIEIKEKNTIFFPMIDARRDEVYTAGYNHKKEMILPIKAQIVNQEFLNSLKDYEKIYFLGEGAKKLIPLFNYNNLTIDDCHIVSAKGMIDLSYSKYQQGDFEDIAYFNPFYLKDFLPNKKTTNQV